MKKSFSFFNIIVAVFLLCAVTVQAQTLVSQWGSTPRGNAWPILNTASTPTGNAGMGADAKPTGWASILGGFDNTIQATTSQAAVVTGTFEFVGGGAGSAYTWLRYAFTYQSTSTLTNQNTPTAAWAAANHSGYAFMPRSGTGTIANGPYGQATLLTIPNAGGWNSSYTGGAAMGVVMQAPNNQVATAGVYDFAISVQPLASGGNEVKWYFVQQHAAGSQNYYWWGGTAIDPAAVSTKFNAVAFSVNSDVDATCKQVNLTNVTYSLGAPITIPAAPWQAFYVTDWGSTPRGTNGWTILNDATYLIGDAAMGGTAKPTGWMSIKGGFNTVTPTTAAPGKAFIISGTFEFVGGGGGSAYTWLRYALFNQAGVLSGQNTPTAAWTDGSTGNGYIFTPVTGTGTISNTFYSWPQGNQGTEWPLVNSNNWNSTNISNSGGPYSTIMQQPARQVATAGVYDWVISVEPKSNGSNQVTWYFIQQHAEGTSNYYWWGGTFNDPKPVTTQFNSIGFACNSDLDATTRQVNIRNVKVDMGSPITVPTAPWQAYYLDKFGIYGTPTGGWTFTADPIIGNATASGPASNQSSASLRAAFIEPVTPTTTKALSITGKMEFVGDGFQASGALRYGIFNSASAGNLSNGVWSGSEMNNTGYLFIPPGSYQSQIYWLHSQKNGTWGSIVNDNWYLPNGPNDNVLGNEQPRQSYSSSKAGVYEFGLSVAPQADGSNEIRNYLISSSDKGKTFYWTTKATDTRVPAAITSYNSIMFRFDRNPSTTAMKILDLKIDLGNPIDIPPDPNATDVENLEGLPMEYSLGQNYPNPFNPTTTIEFALPQSNNVRLIVYDLLGRVVAELVNGELNAGYHKINFNASNLSSGIYFYSLKTGDFSSVKKLVLLK